MISWTFACLEPASPLASPIRRLEDYYIFSPELCDYPPHLDSPKEELAPDFLTKKTRESEDGISISSHDPHCLALAQPPRLEVVLGARRGPRPTPGPRPTHGPRRSPPQNASPIPSDKKKKVERKELVLKELRKQAKKLREHWAVRRVVAPTPFKKIMRRGLGRKRQTCRNEEDDDVDSVVKRV